MEIRGLFNPTHSLRLFLSHEYAFEITYPNKTVRAAHCKGAWTIVKIRLDKVEDYFEFDDCDEGHRAENEMTYGLIAEFRENRRKKVDYSELSRDSDAALIEKILRIWAGDPNKILAMTVVQPGRNAKVDPTTGDFELSPRPEEFKS